MCHQTVSLVARHLEANGIPTVIAGSALDIVEHSGGPRFAFSDFPLGNPLGKPGDKDMQLAITRFALAMLHSANEPGVTLQTPYAWATDDNWRAVYSRVDESNRDALRQKGDARRKSRAQLPKRDS